MKIEFELDPTKTTGNGDQPFALLKEKLFPDHPPSSDNKFLDGFSELPFKPTAADIDEFMKVELHDGLTPSALREIASDPAAGSGTRRQETAKYLDEHFEDVAKLSATGVDKITRSDLELYHELLSLNESAGSESSPDIEAWRKAHMEHELNQSHLPAFSEAGAQLGLIIANKELMSVPAVMDKLVALRVSNPRAFFGGMIVYGTAMGVATWFGGKALGRKANEYWNKDNIKRQFYDEAAPAMKRLMQE